MMWQTPAPKDHETVGGTAHENERFYMPIRDRSDFDRTRNPKIGIHRIDLANGRWKAGQIQEPLPPRSFSTCTRVNWGIYRGFGFAPTLRFG